MMSRKDYVKFAEMLSKNYPSVDNGGEAYQHERLQKEIADIFAGDNPRFDRQRFYSACEPKGE